MKPVSKNSNCALMTLCVLSPRHNWGESAGGCSIQSASFDFYYRLGKGENVDWFSVFPINDYDNNQSNSLWTSTGQHTVCKAPSAGGGPQTASLSSSNVMLIKNQLNLR